MSDSSLLVLHASHVRVEVECPAFCARALHAVYEAASEPLVPTRETTRWKGTIDGDRYRLVVDGVEVSSELGDETTLTGIIETRFLTELAGWHSTTCLLHAGLVELGGVWILFGGDSNRGKSSLTLEAVRRGGRYFTDELVVTDAISVWAVCRTPVFDFGLADSVLPAWIEGADRESYAFTMRDGRKYARPLFSVPRAQWAKTPIPAREVVVVRILERGPDRVAPMTGAEALATLLDASLTREWRQLGPLAADRRAFAISWTTPGPAIDLLMAATSHLASDRRPPSAP